MATCRSCGREIRDDVWTCGFCGATVAQPTAQEAQSPADAGAEESAYGAEGYNPYAARAAASSAYSAARYGGVEPGPAGLGGAAEGMTPCGTPMPQAAPAASGGLSPMTRLVLAGAVVAIVAIVAVWFFVLRAQGGGERFIGTWTAVKNGAGGLVVERGDDGLRASLIGSDQQRVGPLKCDLDGEELEISLEAVGDDDKAAVDAVRALFEATLEDFRIVLTVRDADGRLLLTVSGTAKDGETTTLTPTEFVRAGTSPAL